MLPRDHAGNIDWAAALRRGVIRPRSALPGRGAPAEPPEGFAFAYDFVYQGPDSTLDAYFPHSVHTEWVACRQCHARLFPYRNTPITMGEIFEGKYCAECHGRVAFPVLSGCERCHTKMELPPDRAEPKFLGTIVMRRVTPDSGNTAVVTTGTLAAATFPHWAHRIRYRCKVCHMDLFEPRAGANAVTMAAIADDKACGRCHNGETAFRAGFGACERCHVPQPAAPSGQ